MKKETEASSGCRAKDKAEAKPERSPQEGRPSAFLARFQFLLGKDLVYFYPFWQ